MHHNPICIENLSYTYPDGTPALHEINLSIRATERVALIGANGSGKSTLLLHLNGIFLPQVGRAIVGELAIEPKNWRSIRDFVGLVFQNPDDQLFMLTVWEDVTVGPQNQGLRGAALAERAMAAMLAVGIDPQRYAQRHTENLSGGEKSGSPSPESWQ
jgi:cobalt/nickel transport system ATP-binding protein